MSAPALEIATPERIRMSLPVAGIGYRSLAYLLDLGLMAAFWFVAYFAITLAIPDPVNVFRSWSGVLETVFVISVFAAQWVYWTLLEAFWGGRTVGKRVMRIRVVRLDGSPVGLLESAIRNLLRLVDFLPALYGTGVLCMLLTPTHRRLGDLLAGAILVREEQVSLDKYTSPVDAPAGGDGETLAAAEVELILGYLDRAPALEPDARRRLAGAMIDRFASGVSAEERVQLKGSVEAAEAYLVRRART